MIDACIEAYNVNGDKNWIEEARRCFDWFLGRNDLNVPLYDYRAPLIIMFLKLSIDLTY